VTRLLLSGSPGETRIAVVEGETLVDYALWRPGAPDGVGDLHRARVIARVPAMAGAFLALESGEGFLPDTAGPPPAVAAGEGAILAVRVSRAAQGGKGPRLSARLTAEEAAIVATGRNGVGLLRRGPDPLHRLAARHPQASIVADEPGLLATIRQRFGARATLGSVPEAVLAQIAGLETPEAVLAGGVRLSFHPTPALTAIDVDAGSASARRQEKTAAQRALNHAMLPALARQIVLRDLSGAILVDFAGLSPRRRGALGPALAAALAANDPLGARLLGFTHLGLAEILRPRVHPPLHEQLAGPHAAGLAALRQLAAEWRGSAGLRLRAAPSVVAALQMDVAACMAFEQRCGAPVPLRADPTLLPEGWAIETAA
jgi:Ribonuclease G/E